MCDDDKVRRWVLVSPGVELEIEYKRVDLEMAKAGHTSDVPCKVLGVNMSLAALGEGDD